MGLNFKSPFSKSNNQTTTDQQLQNQNAGVGSWDDSKYRADTTTTSLENNDVIHDGSTDVSGDAYRSQDSYDPKSGVKRGLKTRHISMMALAGIIGPGLLVGAGSALANGGPLALIIGFATIAILALSVASSLGEMISLYPTGGSFITLADRFIDRSFAFAVGWNYFIVWIAVLANEYNMVTSILHFWSDKVPLWGWFLIFWFIFLGFQLIGVEAFGELEYWLALLKLGGLFAFFIFSIVYVSGGIPGRPAFGFHYWNDPGSLSNGFRGVASVFVFCSTFYAGVESVAVAATETRNPSVAIPRAIKQVFWRIVFVYMGSALFFGMTVPWNSEGLVAGSEKAMRSPMTIAIQNAGWQGGIHLINAFILATCLSAINSSIYIGSRTVLFMAQGGTAPKFLGKTNGRGVPVYAIIFTNLFGSISMMNITQGAGKAFGYIVNLSGVATFLVWGSISLTHLRFRRAWTKQGRDLGELPYRAWFFPWFAWFGLGFNVFLAFVQGWATLSPFNAGNFVDAYILLPLFFIMIVGYKFWFKTKFANLDTMDLDEGRRADLDKAKDIETAIGPEDSKRTKLKKFWDKL